jgi:hypothetical protein
MPPAPPAGRVLDTVAVPEGSSDEGADDVDVMSLRVSVAAGFSGWVGGENERFSDTPAGWGMGAVPHDGCQAEMGRGHGATGMSLAVAVVRRSCLPGP